MKHIPILFSTEMVQALLKGRKYQTRRLKGLELMNQDPNQSSKTFDPYWSKYVNKNELFACDFINRSDKEMTTAFCPYGKPGDILWVRETFFEMQVKGDARTINKYRYKADGEISGEKWKPGIHMPKEAARIFLQVKQVRSERLQDITDKDSLAEGVDHVIDKITGYCGRDYLSGGYNLMTTPYHGFRSLWISINGKESWDANPWVWVISFDTIEKPQNWLL